MKNKGCCLWGSQNISGAFLTPHVPSRKILMQGTVCIRFLVTCSSTQVLRNQVVFIQLWPGSLSKPKHIKCLLLPTSLFHSQEFTVLGPLTSSPNCVRTIHYGTSQISSIFSLSIFNTICILSYYYFLSPIVPFFFLRQFVVKCTHSKPNSWGFKDLFYS